MFTSIRFSIGEAMEQESPVEDLNMQFAKGEITHEQHMEMLSELQPASISSENTSTQPQAPTIPDPPPELSSTPNRTPVTSPKRRLITLYRMYLFVAVLSGLLTIVGLVTGDRILSLALGVACIATAYGAWQERGKN